MERSKWRPTPGTVFGLLALVIAVAGTAIAGPLARTSVLNKKEKKQVKSIANGQINQLAPGLAVAKAENATNAANASNAAKVGGADVCCGVVEQAVARAAEATPAITNSARRRGSRMAVSPVSPTTARRAGGRPDGRPRRRLDPASRPL